MHFKLIYLDNTLKKNTYKIRILYFFGDLYPEDYKVQIDIK